MERKVLALKTKLVGKRNEKERAAAYQRKAAKALSGVTKFVKREAFA